MAVEPTNDTVRPIVVRLPLESVHATRRNYDFRRSSSVDRGIASPSFPTHIEHAHSNLDFTYVDPLNATI
jgi:hypothetical protein